MSAPTAKDVIDHHSYLEGLTGEREMRERTKRIWEEYAMRGAVEFPAYVARGDTRTLPVADLIDMAYSLQAERHGHQTSVVLTARDKTPQTTVDRIEGWISMRVAQHLKRWNLVDEGGWHQLMSYAGIVTWHPLGPRSPIHSRIETPDPTTFCFPVAGAPIRPREFSREFEMQVSDTADTYEQGGKSPYLTSNGTWDWYTSGADRPKDQWTGGTGSRFGHNCRIIHDDDGTYTTYVARNQSPYGKKAGPANGEILWQDKNRAGPDEYGQACSQAVVIPGMIQPMRNPKDRLLPMFMPGIQCQHAINYLVALMASKLENAKTDIIVEQTVDTILANQRKGVVTTSAMELEPGMPNITEVAGKPLIWNELPIPYLVDLFGFWTNRYDRWANSLKEISDPTLLSEINTNVYLPHSAARRKLLRPVIDFTNAGLAELIRMDIMALEHLGRKTVDLYAKGGEYRGKGFNELPVGESRGISWEDVKGWDDRFVLSIATNDMSDEEMRQLMIKHDEKVQMGYATKRQGLGVAGYADEEAQVLVLAEDEFYLEGSALVKPQISKTIQQALYYSSGMLLPIDGATTGAPVPGGTPPTDTGTTYNTPNIPGAKGASQPAVAGAA